MLYPHLGHGLFNDAITLALPIFLLMSPLFDVKSLSDACQFGQHLNSFFSDFVFQVRWNGFPIYRSFGVTQELVSADDNFV
jgi:hypothetical protein